MSYCYSTRLALGVIIKHADVDNKFLKTIPAVTHTEERWDPKTGAKLSSVTVTDKRSHEVHIFDGKTYDDECMLYNDLAESVGSSYEEMRNADWNESVHVFAVSFPTEAKYSVNDEYEFEDRIKVIRASWITNPDTMHKMSEICKELDKMGLAHSEPIVISVLDKG